MKNLSTMGFSPFFRDQIKPNLETTTSTVARITAEHRGGYHIWSEAGAGFARLAGRLLHNNPGGSLPGVGDWVILRTAVSPDDTGIIEQVLTRKTLFTRGAAGRSGTVQIIAANIDIVFVVCGLDADFNVRRIERYLSRIWASGASPLIVLNKSDLCNDVAMRLVEVESSAPGVDIVLVSALHRDGVDNVREFIKEGITAAFVGSSGAGKSTLINALLGDDRIETQQVRASDGRGVHTTTHRQLFTLNEGGMVIDTPGMRELQLFDEKGIDSAFAEIDALSAACRFVDCRHITEPGCAVQHAVANGTLDAKRLENYMKLQKEAQAYEVRHDARKRKVAARNWGQIVREGRRLNKLKGKV
ncbi:MAG: ribosome small subunit-dependent GTPase A [Deltaproteobacteria bacterium]|nr:ribosome small subunit-dependent GTPase A [Deltaproteobacteria bacterium]